MRNKNIITILLILGIFIVVDLSMLAQTVVIPEAPAVPELELVEIEEIV